MNTTRTQLGPIIIGQYWTHKDDINKKISKSDNGLRRYQILRITLKYVTLDTGSDKLTPPIKIRIGNFLDEYVLTQNVKLCIFRQNDGSLRKQIFINFYGLGKRAVGEIYYGY